MTYRHEVYADTVEEAITAVQEQDDDGGVEVDSSAPQVVSYRTYDQTEWTDVVEDDFDVHDPIPEDPGIARWLGIGIYFGLLLVVMAIALR